MASTDDKCMIFTWEVLFGKKSMGGGYPPQSVPQCISMSIVENWQGFLALTCLPQLQLIFPESCRDAKSRIFPALLPVSQEYKDTQ